MYDEYDYESYNTSLYQMNFKISNIGLKYDTHKIVISVIFVTFTVFFSAPELKAQVHYCDHPLSVVRPSVVNFSHFRLLLWNRWTEFNETWQEARS